nr:hypothetical protein GCM10025732_17200 [Glycomyces mayteni]
METAREPAPEETTPEQHEAFYRTVARTEAAAQHAAQAAPEDPTPWFTLVVLARARGYDPETFTGIWSELQARDPLHRAGHEFALMYWSPEGNGSYDPPFAFAERAAAAHPSLAFLTVQAAYDYEDVDEHVWKDARVQHAVDAVLRHLGTREGAAGPYANADRGWAAYGLVNSGRGPEAIPSSPPSPPTPRPAPGRTSAPTPAPSSTPTAAEPAPQPDRTPDTTEPRTRPNPGHDEGRDA